MAVSNLDVRASQPIIGGPVHIRLPSGKYIGRADIETALYAPKPIIVRDTPYTWQVYGKENTTHYNLIAGKEAGSWSSNGHQVYAFVAPVKGQKKATDLLLQHTGSKNSLKFYIKQANESIAGDARSGAWYVRSQDEFSPVFAGGKGASKYAVPFTFIPQPIAIEGGGIARDVSKDDASSWVQVV